MASDMLRGYLFAFCTVVAVPLGSLALLMLQHLTGGAWGIVIRRPLEAATRTLPLMALLFLPLAYFLSHVYPWIHDESLGHKLLYLNPKWFRMRAAVYFGVWIVLSLAFNFWSRRQDADYAESRERRFRLLAGPGLAVYGLTITFASIDWVMSLEPHWFSSIYGVLFGVGQMLSALAFGIIVVCSRSGQPPLHGVVTTGHFRDLGNLLLAFVMVWAYLSVSQLIIIWSGNLKEEVPYYLARIQGGWAAVAVALAGLQFAIPFVFLMGRDGKRDPRQLLRVAGLVLVMRAVEMHWLISPAKSLMHESPAVGASLVGAASYPIMLACVAGVWLAAFSRELSRMPLLPVNVDASVAEDHHV